MSDDRPAWVRRLQVVYGSTVALWLAGLAYVAFAEFQVGFNGSFFGASGTAIMAVLGTGPIYLTVKAIRLSQLSPENRDKSAEKIFALQQVAGVPLIGGAILGLLPAAVNIGSFFSGMASVDQLTNAAFIIPWTMVYVFTATHLVVMTIRRGLRAQALATTPEQQAPGSTPKTPKPTPETPTLEGASTPKLPIAPNLFLGAALVLGYLTIDVELRAWEMARNGELTQLESTGPVFSFYQFLDLTMGNFVALVVLIFGIINWPRETVTFRRFTTPIVAAVALAIAPGTVALGIVGLTGLSGNATERNENAQIGSEWINSMIADSMPDGFSEVSTFLDCGVENCLEDPDSEITFVLLGGYESVADSVCQSSIAYATSRGATDYAVNPDYEPVSYREDDAQAACVSTLMTPDNVKFAVQTWSPTFRLSGVSDGVPFVMDLHEYRFGTQSMDPGKINYFLTVRTTLQPDALLPGQDQLSAGTHELDDLLTVIGQARLSDPDVDPNDGDLIRSALATYPHDIPVTPLVDKDGKIRFIEIQTSDDPQPMCVSIAPWDEEYNGIPDPGSGYGVSSAESVKDLKANPMFGTQAWGTCSE